MKIWYLVKISRLNANMAEFKVIRKWRRESAQILIAYHVRRWLKKKKKLKRDEL